MGPAVAENFHKTKTKKDLTGMVEIAQILRRLYIALSADIHVSPLKGIRKIAGTKLSRKSRTPKAPNRVELRNGRRVMDKSLDRQCQIARQLVMCGPLPHFFGDRRYSIGHQNQTISYQH